jgi:hypothetical protein
MEAAAYASGALAVSLFYFTKQVLSFHKSGKICLL